KMIGAEPYRPRISLRRASFSWPKPGPPSSSSRNSAHSPRSLTCCLRGSTSALALGFLDHAAPGNTRSRGSISVRQSSSTQSSCSWNSGSVEKSHAIAFSARPFLPCQVIEPTHHQRHVGVLEEGRVLAGRPSPPMGQDVVDGAQEDGDGGPRLSRVELELARGTVREVPQRRAVT